MKKTKLTINTKVKYIDSPNYQKHFTLDDRIKIQKIISEHRDDSGKLTIMLKDIGNMLSNDPSTISKEVKLHRIFKNHSDDKRLGAYNAICSKFKECKKNACIEYYPHMLLKNYCKCIDRCKDYEEYVCPHLKKFPWVCNGCPKATGCHLNKYYYYADCADKDYKLTLKETNRSLYQMLETAKKQNKHIVDMIPMIEDEAIQKELNEINDSVTKIIETISKNPKKVEQTDNFFDYYLPITVNILKKYDESSSSTSKTSKGMYIILSYIDTKYSFIF